jgi:nitrilase
MAGMTGVVGPNGKHIAGPAGPGEEIVYADLDPASRLRAKYMVDGAGHYSRSDAVSVVIHDPTPPLVTRDR